LVNRAWEILKKDSDQSVIDENETGITTEEATLVFENLLKELRLESWGVIVEPHMNAKILVNNTKKQIKLRSDVSWSKTMIKRLGVHEVGTHLLRHHNGSKQFLKMFSRGWPGYLSTEEGLAVYNEDKMNLLSEDTLRKYASRVIAAYLALNYSFWEVFITLVEYIGWEEAFEVTVRAKRGFVDTSSYGTHLKDTSYLKGWIKVKQHLKNYPEDYKLLYIGKIGLEHLDLIKDWLAHGLITDESLLYPKSVVLDSEYFA
jgi:hypothetical protein